MKAVNTLVDQMRRIATAIKSCPEEVEGQLGEFATIYIGPPTNLEWDVVESKTARAPFQGTVKFSLPEHFEETEEAKHSKKLHHNYVVMLTAQQTFGQASYHQYEFDLGNAAPELVKMLLVNSKTNETKPLSGKMAESTCWAKAARMPEK
jgi:hypothetical protein